MTRALRFLIALLIGTVLLARPQGQSPPSTDELVVLMGAAQKAYARSAWDDATEKFQRIIDLARERHDDLWEARGVSGLGAVAHVRGRYDEAQRLFSTSLSTFDRLDAMADAERAERSLGDVAYVRHDLKGARAWYEKAANSAARSGNESGRIRAARLIIRLNDDEGAMKPLDQIAQLARDAKTIGEAALEAPILHDWADMLFNRGQYEAAIEKLDASAAIYESLGQSDDLATVYNSLGRIYRVHGQPNAALQAQLKALEISERSGAPYARVQSLNAVAVAYTHVGDRAKARDYFERALALAEEVKLSMALPTLRANVGDFLVHTGDVARGRTMIEASMQDQVPAVRSLRYAQLANADLRLGERAAARADVARAFATCDAAGNDSCVVAHLTSAALHLANNDDAAALADQRAAVDALERLQTTLAASDFLKRGFSAWWANTYSLAIDLEARQGNWRAALETAELARARAFVDLMASRAGEGRPQPEARVDLTWRGLPAAAPADVRSEATAAPSTLADLSAVAARQHTTLLQFWLAERSLYAWVVDGRGTVHGARTDVPSATIEQLVRAVGSGASAAATKREAWAALYDALVKPVEPYLPATPGARLTIVPHGPLIQLPFAALRDPRGRYLVERFTLASIPSVAMLRYAKAGRDTNARSGSILLVADPTGTPAIPGEMRLPRLPGAMEETRAIARLVPASRATLLTQANATEPRVLAAAPQKSVIHFATHAIVRDGDPWSSFLALGVAGEGAADGKLTAQKIYGLSLDADLVVLSACRSGGGLITGDGIASLARAFFYAGASSMIVSVWDVADEPAKRLLPAFYRSWLAGADKATALRAAQLALIRDLRAGRVMVATPAGDVALVENPALWAGFVLLGDPG